MTMTMPNITDEDRRCMQKSIDRWGEFTSYLLEHPDELDKVNGATVVHDEANFERLKKSGAGKIVYVKKTYQYIYA